MFQNHRLRPIGHASRYLQAADDGARMHHQSLGRVRGQRSMLYRSIENLLANALKFTQPGKQAEVWVYTEDEGPRLRICRPTLKIRRTVPSMLV